jgi:hypothetical protein
MRSHSIRIAAVAASMLLSVQVWAQNPGNPLEVAELRWYQADLTGLFTTNLGTYSYKMAFDGSNIWIVNSQSYTVTKLRASDGACVGTCVFSAGGAGNDGYTGDTGIAFDGANMWVANFSNNTVAKLRASDGANLGVFPTGSGPWRVAFDGAKIWVENLWDNTVTVLRASDGSVFGTFPAGPAGGAPNPAGLAFDGTYMWVLNSNNNWGPNPGTVTRLLASSGACVTPCTFNVGNVPYEIAFDGANMWVSNGYDSTVTRLRASDGACVGSCTLPVGEASGDAAGLAFDGTYLWVAGTTSSVVTKIRASDGANFGIFPLGGPGTILQCVAFDGAHVWASYYGDDAHPGSGAFKL